MPANQDCEGSEADLLGEGKESGEINTAQSLVFTSLQVKPCCSFWLFYMKILMLFKHNIKNFKGL